MPLSDRIALQMSQLEFEDGRINNDVERVKTISSIQGGVIAQFKLGVEQQLVLAEAKQAFMDVKATAPATVNEIYITKGSFVTKGDRLLSLSNRPEPVVHVYLRPSRLDYAHVGSRATVTMPNGKKYRGEVKVPVQMADKISQILSGPFSTDNAAIKVQIDFDEAVEEFIEGLPVKVRFHYWETFSDWFPSLVF